MKFSVITINYNNCKGLKRTLDSIISQTSRDFEWIVIDGGSTDGSRELIEQYQDSISFWCSELDNGIYNAMNKGITRAKGDYCLFLNSGDKFCGINVMERLEEITFEADIVSCDMYIDEVSASKLRISVDIMNAFWIYENTLFHPSTWIRREVLLKCPYRENFERISDWAFFFEAIVVYNCSYQHVPMAISIFFSGGISSQPFPVGNTDRTDFLKSFFPEKFITDVRLDKIYRLSVDAYRLTRYSQRVVFFIFRVIEYIDFKLLRPLERLLKYRS